MAYFYFRLISKIADKKIIYVKSIENCFYKQIYFFCVNLQIFEL